MMSRYGPSRDTHMLNFLVSAWFRADADPNWDAAHPGVYIQHLKTFVPQVDLEGVLFAPTGPRSGIFVVLTSPSFEEVAHFVATSPYQLAGLYDRVDIHRMEIESGRLT